MPTIGVLQIRGEAAWKGLGRGGRVEGGRGGAQRGFARRDTMREGLMPEQGAMARSAGRGMAMPSGGRRAAAGAFAFDHGERPRVFGDGAKHRAEASNVATLEESANDEGAKRRVVRRETQWRGRRNDRHGKAARPRSGEWQPAMPFAEWRAVACGRYAAVGRASERPGGAAHAASRTRSGDGRIGSNGDRKRKRRWRVAPSRDARHRERSIQRGRSLARERRTGLAAEAGAAAKRPCS